MRRQLLIFLLIGSAIVLNGQTVDSIKVEQAGDFIRIGYRILNSTPDQVFRVRVLCSINGGLNTELRSVSGDVGDNVRGGKEEYFAVWDVLRDVDELSSAEFIVRAELTGGEPAKIKKESSSNFNAMFSTQVPGFGYGVRIGYMGKMGVSARFISGKTVYKQGFTDHDITRLLHYGIGLTSRLVNSDSFQLHLLTGISVGDVIINDISDGNPDYPVHQTPGLEAGLIFCHKRVVYSVSLAGLFVDLTEEDEAITKHGWMALGLGFRF